MRHIYVLVEICSTPLGIELHVIDTVKSCESFEEASIKRDELLRINSGRDIHVLELDV